MKHALSYLAGAAAAAAGLIVFLPAAMAQVNEVVRFESDPIERVVAARQAADAEDMRVIGGTAAESGAWPFQVALLRNDLLTKDRLSQFQAQYCGGSLIASQWVLTAAHCVAGDDGSHYLPEWISVLVGATSLTEGERVRVSEIIVHENYDPYAIENDIALIKLVRPVNNPTVALNKTADTPESGAAMAIGWGMTGDGSFPVDLLEAHIEMQSSTLCNRGIKNYLREGVRAYIRDASSHLTRFEDAAIDQAVDILDAGMRDPVTDVMVCAGIPSGEISICYGDSGGPLFVMDESGKPLQVGVSSWTAGPYDAANQCGHANSFAVYARVGAFYDWIQSKTGS